MNVLILKPYSINFIAKNTQSCYFISVLIIFITLSGRWVITTPWLNSSYGLLLSAVRQLFVSLIKAPKKENTWLSMYSMNRNRDNHVMTLIWSILLLKKYYYLSFGRENESFRNLLRCVHCSGYLCCTYVKYHYALNRYKTKIEFAVLFHN